MPVLRTVRVAAVQATPEILDAEASVRKAARLLGEIHPRPPGVPQAAHHHRRQDRGLDRVAHRVGHRDVQRPAVQREVERVAAHVARRLEPGRQRELAGLARVGAGQQPVLDLGGQAQRTGAVAPLVQVGVPPVGDHHEAQQVRNSRDLIGCFGVRPFL